MDVITNIDIDNAILLLQAYKQVIRAYVNEICRLSGTEFDANENEISTGLVIDEINYQREEVLFIKNGRFMPVEFKDLRKMLLKYREEQN